jgi:hypothetical protein
MCLFTSEYVTKTFHLNLILFISLENTLIFL